MPRPATDDFIPGIAALSVGHDGRSAPEGWKWVRITDVARLESGHTPSRKHPEYWDGDVSWVGIKDARENHGRRIVATSQTITPAGLANSAARLLPAGTVCLSRTASVGYVTILGSPMATSQDFVNWVCSEALEPQFLMYALMAEGEHIREFGKGTTHTTIYFPEVQAFHLCMPPLAEQRRIVEKVEALLAEVNAARVRLAQVPHIFEGFRQSILAAACSGRLTEGWRAAQTDVIDVASRLGRRRADKERNSIERRSAPAISGGPDQSELPDVPETWALAFLPELGELNRGKSRHRPRNDPRLYGGPYPFIQTGDVARSGGMIAAHSQTYNAQGLAQSRLWPAGTACITIAANIAESGILSYPACFPDSVVGFIADPSIAVSRYVELFVRTARANLAQYAPATAQANINLEILREVAVPLPSVEEQHEIVIRVDTLFALADTIEGRVATATARADKLTQSILAKAFRGELVPSEADLAREEGREYESAAALLERIRADASGVATRTPRRRSRGRAAA
jgi:type I restriction enzyme, S subunit